MEPLDFLDAPEGVTEAVQPVAPEAQNEPPVQAAAEPEPAPEPAPEPVAPPPAPPEPGHVPLSAMLDEREKRKAAEDRLRALEQAHRTAPPPQAAPDPYEDPQGYQAHVDNRVQAVEWRTITNISMVMAHEKYGAETVTAAAEALAQELQQKPGLWHELQQQPHPYEWAVKRHQRETAYAKIDPSQIDAFLAWQQGQAAPAAQPVATIPVAAPAAPKPPVSLASAPSAGGLKPGAVPVGPGEAFNSVFRD